MHLVCFGPGYTASYVAAIVQAQGGRVTNVGRRVNNGGVAFEEAEAVEDVLREATHVLSSIPPVSGHDIVLHKYHRALAGSVNLKWVGYLSTIGVYGDTQGHWVDERAPCVPQDIRTKSRLDVESQWQALPLPWVIFRLAGIYGPGRSVLDKLRANHVHERIDAPGHVFNRIYVKDLADMVFASMQRGPTCEIYNLSDDLPAPGREPIDYSCDLLHVPYPPLIPFEEATLSPMMQSFYQGCRRIKNTKAKALIGGVLKFPTYREGLHDIWINMEKGEVK